MARDLRLFYLFRLLATSYLWVPIFFAFQASRGLSFGEIMFLGGMYSLVVILVEVPTGAFADRIGRRQSMMLGAATMVASCLISYGAHDFWTFALAEALAAVSMSLCSGADSAYLFDLLAENGVSHEYGRRESMASAWHMAGSAVAYAGGGFLAYYHGLAVPYLVTAGVASAAFVVAATMRDDRPRIAAPLRLSARAAMQSWSAHIVRAFKDVLSSGRLSWIIGYSAVVFVLLRSTSYFYQPYLKARSFDHAEIGLIYAGVYLLASFVAHQGHVLRRRFGDEALLWGLLGGLTITFLLLEQLHGPWALVILGIQAFGNGLYSPLVKPLLNREIVDSSRRATVLSVESIVRRGVMGIVAPLAGLSDISSASYLYGLIGLLGLVVLGGFAVRWQARQAEAEAPDAPVLAPIVSRDRSGN